jgi:Kdo2-lipid IVA lauroyltransferase/acyltransferase
VNPVVALLLRVPLHGLGLAVAFLPRGVELALGRFLGRLALSLAPTRARVARENIARCLPEWTDAQRARLLRDNYEHYGVMTLELAHMFAPIPGHWLAYARRVARVVDLHNWRAAHDKGRGVLFCSTHHANWELMAAGGAQAGVPITIVTRKLKPQWLHDWMVARRLETGVRCAIQPRTMPAVLKGLKNGESVGFVMDQYMLPPMGAPLRFFGVMVDTLTAVAPLARRTGAAIVTASTRRDADGIVRIRMEPEFPLDGSDDEVNQRLADKVEAWIRENPSQWLWGHRRFKGVDWSKRLPADRRSQAA